MRRFEKHLYSGISEINAVWVPEIRLILNVSAVGAFLSETQTALFSERGARTAPRVYHKDTREERVSS